MLRVITVLLACAVALLGCQVETGETNKDIDTLLHAARAKHEEHWTRGAPWNGAEMVIVVTWYNSSLAWLDELPFEKLHGLKVALYCKQDENVTNGCNKVSPKLKKALAVCHEVPNAGGREQHTIGKFLNDYYGHLPRVVVFAQDDCNRHDCPPRRVLQDMTPASFSRLLRKIEEQPFETDTCFCGRNVEARFRVCDLDKPFRTYPIEASCYGDMWHQITYIWNITGRRNRSEMHVIRWADQGQFAVPAYAIRSLPRMAFAVVEHLTDGKYQKGVFATVDSTLAFSPPHRRLSQCGGPLTSHEWAYALERSWFGLLDPEYEMRAARDEHIALEMYAIMEKHKREEVRAQRGPGAHGTTDEGLVY